ncbi:hypothetical protein F5Y04DRAFT_288492 [Hypomontagnella monticulosa]|nr:hypothetical protein F5Y04DRAFT_288492 [Hypomontagnella monticulosa]
MGPNVDPLGLYISPCHESDRYVVPQPDINPDTQGFGFFNDFQQLPWDGPVPEDVATVEVTPNQLGSSANCHINGTGTSNETNPSLYDFSIKPSQWQQMMLPSYPPAKRGICIIDDREDDLEADFLHPAKRRRTQSKTSSPPSSVDGDLGVGGNGPTTKLEKNRAAASKCREKKKRETAELQAKESMLAARRDVLRSTASALRTEVVELKTEILRHGMCECPVIRKFITESAGRIA